MNCNKDKHNKKGFTLVELVIVIAVIAILAGVMISTFSNVVTDAQKAAALQEVKSQLDAAYINYVTEYGEPEYMSVDKTTYKITFYMEGDKVVEEKCDNLDFYSLSVGKDESLVIKVKENSRSNYLLLTWSSNGYSVDNTEITEEITGTLEDALAVSDMQTTTETVGEGETATSTTYVLVGTVKETTTSEENT